MTQPALSLTMTNAGFARFTAAQLGDATDLRISAVGLSDAAIVVAPTLTALPGEFRRIDTLSGKQVGDNIVHLVLRDDVPLTYGIRALALYLSDGTLFAVYGQADRIMEKATAVATLISIDIAFPAANVASISFGNTDFLLPPATTETAGMIEIATDLETADGVDEKRAITPKSLQVRLADLFKARRVNASGLAIGGGDLSADVTIDVPAASAAETEAGVVADKAVTPAGLVGILSWIAARVPKTRTVQTSGLVTGGGSLDADLTINVLAASADEAMGATVTTKAVTPFSLSKVVEAIMAKVPLTRLVSTSGLAIGGNALNTDITISVPAATAAQLRAGTASNVAATPDALAAAGVIYLVESKSDGSNRYRRFSDGSVEMMGVAGFPGSEASFTLNFPWPFPTACDGVWGTIINTAQTNDGQSTMQEVALSAGSALLYAQNHKSPTNDAAGGFRWFARGH